MPKKSSVNKSTDELSADEESALCGCGYNPYDYNAYNYQQAGYSARPRLPQQYGNYGQTSSAQSSALVPGNYPYSMAQPKKLTGFKVLDSSSLYNQTRAYQQRKAKKEAKVPDEETSVIDEGEPAPPVLRTTQLAKPTPYPKLSHPYSSPASDSNAYYPNYYRNATARYR